MQREFRTDFEIYKRARVSPPSTPPSPKKTSKENWSSMSSYLKNIVRIKILKRRSPLGFAQHSQSSPICVKVGWIGLLFSRQILKGSQDFFPPIFLDMKLSPLHSIFLFLSFFWPRWCAPIRLLWSKNRTTLFCGFRLDLGSQHAWHKHFNLGSWLGTFVCVDSHLIGMLVGIQFRVIYL